MSSHSLVDIVLIVDRQLHLVDSVPVSARNLHGVGRVYRLLKTVDASETWQIPWQFPMCRGASAGRKGEPVLLQSVDNLQIRVLLTLDPTLRWPVYQRIRIMIVRSILHLGSSAICHEVCSRVDLLPLRARRHGMVKERF